MRVAGGEGQGTTERGEPAGGADTRTVGAHARRRDGSEIAPVVEEPQAVGRRKAVTRRFREPFLTLPARLGVVLIAATLGSSGASAQRPAPGRAAQLVAATTVHPSHLPAVGAAVPAAAPGQEWSNEECLLCHAEADVVEMAEANPRPGLLLDPAVLAGSVHGDFDCVFCHEGIDDIPHAAELAPADPLVCSSCHDDVYEIYRPSVHGVARAAGDGDAATCSDCHGTHDILPASDEGSRVFPLTLPATCGVCHADELLAREHAISVPDAYQRYVESVHGRGLLRAGLLVSASCNDCHASHAIFPNDDPRSPLFRDTVPETCGTCHQGVLRQYRESAHGSLLEQGNPDVPACTTCHTTHAPPPAVEAGFRAAAVAECGNCHADKLDTYRGTLHGKANELGYTDIAACSSCHTPHHNLPAADPRSSVAAANLVATCSACHVGANESFVQYRVHADPTDRHEYPLLYFIYFGMVGLLSATMVGATAHTALWYRRLRQEQRAAGDSYRREEYWQPSGAREYVRFNLFNRVLHVLVMSSFMILVATGIPLHFADSPWAAWLMGFFGGFRAAGWVHRFGAAIMFVYVLMHLGYLVYLKLAKGQRGLLSGPDSLMPRWRDVTDFVGQVKWFLGRGPQPQFGRWTYWEKFDYLADAWGVIVFGSTGMILWFPVFFTRWLPGWTINVAFIVHGIEALLALSFIFTVHFFNAHLRPGKFPLDPVFLTGRITVEELAAERPLEYRKLVESEQLESRLTEPASALTRHYARVIGYTALTIGLALVAIVFLSLLLRLLF